MSTPSSERGRLAVPDLDDRRWQDLVDEARALIPKYAPQWTDHNPSDLGVTLVELFAHLVEGLIYRLNRVPDKNYLAFLDLLGITRDPGTPAQALLTFTAQPGTAATVPKGTQAQTRPSEAETPVVFETDADLTLVPGGVVAALLLGPANTYTNVAAGFAGTAPAGGTLTVPARQAAHLCLGFDHQVNADTDLLVELAEPLPPTEQVQVTWVHSAGTVAPAAWPAAPVRFDQTGGLRRDGTVRVGVPAGGWAAQAAQWPGVSPAAGTDAISGTFRWLGLRVANGSGTPVETRVRRLLVNTVAATAALSIRVPEELGAGDGTPFQVLPLRNRPLFKRPETDTPYDHLAVEVDGTPWALVDEPRPGAGRWFRLNPVTAEVAFGNHDPSTGRGGGTVPPAGSRVVARSYRHVTSGAAGNVGPGALTTIATPVASVTGVSNPYAAEGGSDEEPIEDAKRRAPDLLRNRNRAVTAEDYEFLAKEATTDVAIVRCLPPRVHEADNPPVVRGDPWTYAALIRAPGNVNLIIIPRGELSTPRPQPSTALVHEVLRHLDQRRDVTARLHVTGPRYLPVKVVADVHVWRRAIDEGRIRDAAEAHQAVRDHVARFLHPVRGGPAGAGWQVGQHVFLADAYQAVKPDDEIGYIASLTLQPLVPPYHDPPLGPGGNWDPKERPLELPPTPGPLVLVAEYETVCHGETQLVTHPPE
jgi:predicted phage baseplate assembly protein